MYIPTSQDLRMLSQSQKNMSIYIQLLNYNFQTVDEVNGRMIDDSFSFDATSDYRRSYQVTFVVDDKYIGVASDKKLWLDKLLRVYIGIEDIITSEIIRYPMGIYVMNSSQSEYSPSTSTLNLTCTDMVAMLNGTVKGQLRSMGLTIPEGSNIRSVLISTLSDLGEVRSYRIEDMKKTIPYELTFSTGQTVWDVVVAIRDLYPGWEAFFDTNGQFIFQPIPTAESDPVIIESETLHPLIISEQVSIPISQVRNCTKVYGKCLSADRYSDTSSGDGSIYNVSFTTPVELETGTTIAFKCNVNNKVSPKVNIASIDYPIVSEDGNGLMAGTMLANKSYVLRYRNGRFVYQGEWQIVAMVKEVQFVPSSTQIANDKAKENCDNIKYIVNPHSPFVIEKIGERRQVLSGGVYEKIYTEGLALQRAEYENWQTTRLVDSINVEMMLIPWLNMNEKIEYIQKQTGDKDYCITKRMSGSSKEGIMNLEIIKFYPLYPFIVES